MLDKDVEEIMSPNPLTMSPDSRVVEGASYMGLEHFRRVSGVENYKLVGMISIGEINRWLLF